MTEKEFYKETVLDNIVRDGLILTYAKSEPVKRSFPLRRILIPVLASFAILLTAVMAIPSARAEVFSWFGVKSAKDYLTTDPSERTTIDSIEQMIVPADSSNTQIDILPEKNSDAVNSNRAMEISELISKDFSAVIGDTLFDGEAAYVSIRLSGNAALPLLDGRAGGTLTCVQVDPNLVWHTFENGPDEEFLSGKTPLYERPYTVVMLTFPDGSTKSSFLELADDESNRAFFDSVYSLGYQYDSLTDSQKGIINGMILEYAGSNEISTVLTLHQSLDIIERNAGTDGYAEAKATLMVQVLEDENRPDTCLLAAELGTVRFSVSGYKNMENTSASKSGDEITLYGDALITLSEKLHEDDFEKMSRRLKNLSVSLDGITMRALDGAYVDALGVHDLKIEVRLPENMPSEQKAAFMQGPTLNPFIIGKILVNSEEGGYGIDKFYGYEKIDENTFHIVLGGIRGIPLERLSEVKTITLIPEIIHVQAWQSGSKTIPIPENEWIEFLWNGSSYQTVGAACPQFAITFSFQTTS